MSIEVVYPTPDEVEEIQALYAITWLATYPNEEYGITTNDIELKNAERMTSEWMSVFRTNLVNQKNNPLRFFKIAKDNGRIVGVCGGKETDEVVHLASLYVLPTEQRKGIGSALMKAFLTWANPHKPVRLHVVSYNQTAIEFYKRWGFKDTGKEFTEERFMMASGNALPEIEMMLERDGTERVEIIEPSEAVFQKAAYYIDLVQQLLPNAKVTLVGSLAIPLCIKNEIDVLVEIGENERIEAVQEKITDATLGIFNKGVIVEGEGFNRSKKKFGLICELHILREGDPRIEKYHSFVQRLQSDEVLRTAYDSLKRSLHGVPATEYKAAKEEFFKKNF